MGVMGGKITVNSKILHYNKKEETQAHRKKS
jgi:hypothetical protein